MKTVLISALCFISVGCASQSDVANLKQTCDNAHTLAENAIVIAKESKMTSDKNQIALDRMYRKIMSK